MHKYRHLTGIVLAAIFSLSGTIRANSEVIEVAFPPNAPATSAVDAPEVRGLRIVVDFAAILNVDGGMSVVAVGNPAIANASLVNHRTVIVTGHLPGTTNVIALDDTGRVLADLRIYVTSQKAGMVRVQRGMQVEVRNCISGFCEVGKEEPTAMAAPVAAGPGG